MTMNRRFRFWLSRPPECRSTLLLLLVAFLLTTNAQEPTILWSPSGASLVEPLHWTSAVNFDGSIVTVGGCKDARCANVTSDVLSFDVSTQTVVSSSISVPQQGIAGPFSSVAVAKIAGAGRSLLIVRSCSLCFSIGGMLYPSNNASQSSVSSEFFRLITEVSVNTSAPRGSSGRYLTNTSFGIPSGSFARCNASCVVLGNVMYLVGGVRTDTLEELSSVAALHVSTGVFQPEVAVIPSSLFQLRQDWHAPSVNAVNYFGLPFICSFGRTAPVGVSNNNMGIFLSISCWDESAGIGSTFVTAVVLYPMLTQTLMQPMSLLFSNVSIESGVEATSTSTAIIPFTSQFICTGGALQVAIDFVFNDHVDGATEVHDAASVGHAEYVLMSATEEIGHGAFKGELSLGFTGAEWNLYSLGGLSSDNHPTGAIQIGPTTFGIAAPLEVVVSSSWSPSQGLYDNKTYGQGSFGDVSFVVGANLTLRMTSLSATDLLMVSPFSDCSTPLTGTKIANMSSSYEVTLPIAVTAEELFVCVCDGVHVLAGELISTGAPVLVKFFVAINIAMPFLVHEAPPPTTIAPQTSERPSTATPVTAAPTTESPSTTTPAPSIQPSSGHGLPSWLPLYAVILGGIGSVMLVITVSCGCVYCFRKYSENERKHISQRDLIALENITNSNKYTVIRRLGSGGNGEVFLVKRKKDGELCAIKHVRCVGSKTRDDLFRESDTLDRLKGHPNMVEILEMSLHEVYIPEEDLDDEEDDYSEDEGGNGTFNISEKTELTGDTSARASLRQSRQSRRRRRAGSTFLSRDSQPSTGPVPADQLSLNAGIPQDDSDAHQPGRGATGASDVDGSGGYLQVRRRKLRNRRKSRETLNPGDDITVSSQSRPFLDDESDEPSKVGSELSSDAHSRRRIEQGTADEIPTHVPSGPVPHPNSELSASSYYQSINGEVQQRSPTNGMRKVRFQCIVMKYFKKGDLATYMEQLVPSISSTRGERGRNGSLFSNLISRRRTASRDEVASLARGSVGRGGGGGGYESDFTNVSHACPEIGRSPTPAHNSEDRLEVPRVTNGSDSDEHSAASLNPSDDERNVAPTTEPNPPRVRRFGSMSNMSQASSRMSQGPGSTNQSSGMVSSLREEMIASIVYQVAALLRYLHSRKPHRIVHCDIKPENILVADAIHPLYLQLLGGHAANAMHTTNQQHTARSPSRLFQRYLTRQSLPAFPSNTTGGQYGAVSSPVASERGGARPPSSQASRRTLHRDAQQQSSSPYFVGQSTRSSNAVPNTPITTGGIITPIGELIAAALEDVFLPIVVSDVGQAMEIPWEESALPPQAPNRRDGVEASTSTAAPPPRANVRLVQCTMPYVAPECISSGLRCVTPAIDIWALGCVVYSVCTKKLKNTDVVVMFEEVRKPSFEEDMRFELCDVLGYSPALASLVLAMLHSDPTKRPTAADITNHWMTFVPHMGQELVPGVTKVQVCVPYQHPPPAASCVPGATSTSATRRPIVQ